MQQNQNYNKNSIVDNKELRAEITKNICEYFNNQMKSWMQYDEENKKKTRFTEADLITDEEINEFLNDESIMKKHKLANNGEFILDKMKAKASQYKSNMMIETVKQPLQGRDKYLLTDMDETIEADEHNQDVANNTYDAIGEKTIIYDLLDKYDEVDTSFLYTTNEEDTFNQPDQYTIANDIGFKLDTFNVLDQDPLLKERIDSTTAFRQIQTKISMLQAYRSIYSLLIPTKKIGKIAMVSQFASTFTNQLLRLYPDVKEFQPSNYVIQKYDVKKGKPLDDVLGLSAYISSMVAFPDILKKNEDLKKLAESGVIEKGLGTNYYFIDKNGKLANGSTVLQNVENGQLINGYKKVYWTEKEKQRTNEIKKGVFALTKAIKYNNLTKLLDVE